MGYKTIQINKKQVRLHRYVMECFLGRPLSKDEIVHHKDGNKFNNNIQNLEILTRSEHIKKHYNQIGGVNNQFKKKYNIDREELLNLYQDPFMTHKKLADMFGCSTGCIALLLGKNARKKKTCKNCGGEIRYIKKQLCNKCYQKEYHAMHK